MTAMLYAFTERRLQVPPPSQKKTNKKKPSLTKAVVFLCKLLKVMGTKEMLTGVSLRVNTVAGRSIKYTSITHIHFLSAVCVCVCPTRPEKAKHANSLATDVNGAASPQSGV